MKFRYLFSTVLAASLFFTGCSQNDPETLTEIQVSNSYLTVPESGGTATFTITSTVDWEFRTEKTDAKGKVTKIWPEWLTADKMNGKAGSSTVTLTAQATEFGREAELIIAIDDHTSQFLMVRQGSLEASEATCEDVIDGPDGKTYIVEGVCTSISSTTYGNWYLEDETGEVYIYGTLDAEGKAQNFASLNIEVGDVVKVQGPKTTYGTTVELVDVTVLSIKKALLTVIDTENVIGNDGGEINVRVAYKGKGVFLEASEYDWIEYAGVKYVAGVPTKTEPNPADTAVIKFNIVPFEGNGTREGELKFTSYSGSSNTVGSCKILQGIIDINAAGVNAKADGSTRYRVTGYIHSIVGNENYGNMYLVDYSDTVYVYGTLDAEGKSGNFPSLGIKAGDIVTVVGPKSSYKGDPQMVNVSVEKHFPVEDVTVAAFLEKSNSNDVYYRLTGTAADVKDNDKNGYFNIVDETGTVYVYGLLKGFGGPKQQFPDLGIKNGDKVVLVGCRGSYGATQEVVNAFYVSHESAK